MSRAGAMVVGAASVAALLVLGACSGDDDPTLQGEVPATGASDTSSSTAGSSTTTTVAACPPVERRAEGDGVVEQRADVDGDQQPDVLQSFPVGDHVTLLADLAAGGGATTELAASGDAAVTLVGAQVLDPDHDARAEMWLRVGAGASTTILGLYHLRGCSLEAATFENGEPVELPIGGTVRTASGARCGSGVDPAADLLVHQSTLLSGREYEVVTTEYRWEEGKLVLSPASAPTVTRFDDITEVSGFHCGDLSL